MIRLLGEILKFLMKIGLLAALILLGYVWYVLRQHPAPSPDSNANASYEEITVDISIGNERGTFSNLTRCGRQDIPYSDGAIARYGQTGGAVVGAFPSKKGFILDLGDVCNQVLLLKSIHPWVSEKDTWPGGDPMPGDPKVVEMIAPTISFSRWRLYVFDDVTAPLEGRLFIGPDYFWTGDADIQVHSITSRRPAKDEKEAWHKRWAEGGNYFGWLTDLYNQPGGKDIYFSFIFHSSERLRDKQLAHIASLQQNPEYAGRRWLVLDGGLRYGTLYGRKIYAVDQWPGRLNLQPQVPHSLWTTRVYLTRVPENVPRLPGGLVLCDPFFALQGQTEAEVFVEGEDISATIAELPFDRNRSRKEYRASIIDTQKQARLNFESGSLVCLNPGLIIGHWQR